MDKKNVTSRFPQTHSVSFANFLCSLLTSTHFQGRSPFSARWQHKSRSQSVRTHHWLQPSRDSYSVSMATAQRENFSRRNDARKIRKISLSRAQKNGDISVAVPIDVIFYY